MEKGQRPWSKLQRELYALFAPDLKIQVQSIAYRMKSQRGCTRLARHWITLGKEIIWDYPKDFKNKAVDNARDYLENGFVYADLLRDLYPHGWESPTVADVLREYIDTPKEELFCKSFENDRWGLTDILRAADRRIGKRRLADLKLLNNPAVDKIVEARLKGVVRPAV
jgi:hypothetical protein